VEDGRAEKERLEQDEPWHFLPGDKALGGCCLGQAGLPPDWSQLLEAPFAELPSNILVRHTDLSSGGSLVCKNNSVGSSVWDLQACCPSVRDNSPIEQAEAPPGSRGVWSSRHTCYYSSTKWPSSASCCSQIIMPTSQKVAGSGIITQVWWLV